MEHIKETINGVIRDLADRKPTKERPEPREVLKKLLTKKELAHIKINNFYKGTIYVEVNSSSWLYMLSLRKDELLKKTKEKVPTLKDIRFRMGDMA